MSITFTLDKKTKDGKQTHVPHEWRVLQTKKPNTKEVVVPAKVGPDGIVVPAEKKTFSWFLRK